MNEQNIQEVDSLLGELAKSMGMRKRDAKLENKNDNLIVKCSNVSSSEISNRSGTKSQR